MLDRDPHHAEPANLPPLPPFTCARLRTAPVRAVDPIDPTGTGDAALNGEAMRRGECIHLADSIVRDLIEAARRKRQTIEDRREVLAQIDAAFAEAERIGHAESWTAVVLFNHRLHSARDTLRRYIAQAQAKEAREAAIELRNRVAADAYRDARARGTMEPGEAALIAALSVHVPKAPR